MVASHVDLREGLYVRLSVRDTGAGMDQDTLTRVFDPFFTTKDPGEGTGLGLAVVHGIVQEHDGAVMVSSTPGRGSVFHLFFPAMSQPQAGPAPRPERGELARGHGEHVLFLDDEPAIAHAGRRLLERLGYRVSAYTSPQEALAAFRERPAEFDLLVSDLTMPGMTGVELARELRRLRPDLPVVLTSGYTSVPALEGAGLEVDELLAKPFAIETLAQVLARVLQPRDRRPGTRDQEAR